MMFYRGLLSIMCLLRRFLSSMGCLILGFLVCRLGVMVVCAGEEEQMSVCECELITQRNEFPSWD